MHSFCSPSCPDLLHAAPYWFASEVQAAAAIGEVGATPLAALTAEFNTPLGISIRHASGFGEAVAGGRGGGGGGGGGEYVKMKNMHIFFK